MAERVGPRRASSSALSSSYLACVSQTALLGDVSVMWSLPGVTGGDRGPGRASRQDYQRGCFWPGAVHPTISTAAAARSVRKVTRWVDVPPWPVTANVTSPTTEWSAASARTTQLARTPSWRVFTTTVARAVWLSTTWKVRNEDWTSGVPCTYAAQITHASATTPTSPETAITTRRRAALGRP